MFKIREAIVVEGRYDKNTLSQLVDTLILTTEGFGVFQNQTLAALLRRLAKERGLIILTDSDGAGFVIRNHLKSVLPKEGVKHAYVPDVYGKEKRKKAPGKEGKLGVEGMPPQILEEALRRAGATFLGETAKPKSAGWKPLTKADMMGLGLSGTPDAAQNRAQLLQKLGFPAHMSPNGLLSVLNTLEIDPETYR